MGLAISTKLSIKHPWTVGIQFNLMEGLVNSFTSWDNCNTVKSYNDFLKTSSPEQLGKFQPNLIQCRCKKASLDK